jgi:tRNA(Ile)-lysidine synthase
MCGRIAVAASGGRDSTALLHATARAAFDSGLEVYALHVHHGLLAQADDWAAHLRLQCQRWSRSGLPVHFQVERLRGRPMPGDSVEAWARRERYGALASMARALGIDIVMLAHHRRDQAETLLLQALRGAGAAGLAAMPAAAERDGIQWLRPWLEQPRSAIDAYVRRYRLGFVEDDSNADERFARNRLRGSVWPALEAAFPDAEATLAAAARRVHEAGTCAAELAALDRPHCVDAQGRMRVRDWLRLSAARRANLLRRWLGERLPTGVPDSLVQRLMRELPVDRPGRGQTASWPGAAGALQLHRGLLQWTGASPRTLDRAPIHLDLSRPGTYFVPQWGGSLRVSTAAGQGVPAQLLVHAVLRQREGGEQFQRALRSTPRSLKKQFQTDGVPPWERDGPLVFAGAKLLFVPGLGIDARVLAQGSEATRQLQWEAASAA